MTTIIRRACVDDVAPLAKIAAAFYARGEHWGRRPPLDVVSLTEHLLSLEGNDDAGLFVAVRDGRAVGGLALAITPDVFAGGTAAIKLHWIVDPAAGRGAGLALLRHGEQWARERGAKRMFVGGMTDTSTQLLRGVGYKKTEEIYQRAL